MPSGKEGSLYMDMLRCVVERITFQNEENGYTVLKCKAKGHHELVTVVGPRMTANTVCSSPLNPPKKHFPPQSMVSRSIWAPV
jgi:hypothetical protein